METIAWCLGLTVFFGGMALYGLLSSSDNRRRLAAWLETGADAMDRVAAAKRAIYDEQRRAQARREQQLFASRPT